MNIQLETVLISATIGGVVASLVTAVSTIAGQFFERRHRRQELLFIKSIEMAIERRKLLVETAAEENLPLAVLPDYFTAAEHYEWLEHLFDKGTLPNDIQKDIEQQAEEFDKQFDRLESEQEPKRV